MQFELEFEFQLGKHWPILEFADEFLLTESLVNEKTKRVNVIVNTDKEIFEFKNKNKNEYDTIVVNGVIVQDQTVKLKKIWIDDILLDCNLIRPFINFVPEYRNSFVQYCTENNIDIDYNPYPFELFHNGVWSFKFKKPFWGWYSSIRQQQIKENFTSHEIELYLGTETQDRQNSLLQLKKLLNV